MKRQQYFPAGYLEPPRGRDGTVSAPSLRSISDRPRRPPTKKRRDGCLCTHAVSACRAVPNIGQQLYIGRYTTGQPLVRRLKYSASWGQDQQLRGFFGATEATSHSAGSFITSGGGRLSHTWQTFETLGRQDVTANHSNPRGISIHVCPDCPNPLPRSAPGCEYSVVFSAYQSTKCPTW